MGDGSWGRDVWDPAGLPPAGSVVRSPRRRMRSSGGTTRWRPSTGCWPLPTRGCSRSPVHPASARRGSRSPWRRRQPRVSRTVWRSWTSPTSGIHPWSLRRCWRRPAPPTSARRRQPISSSGRWATGPCSSSSTTSNTCSTPGLLLAAALAGCPGLTLLMTSRERLHLRAERGDPGASARAAGRRRPGRADHGSGGRDAGAVRAPVRPGIHRDAGQPRGTRRDLCPARRTAAGDWSWPPHASSSSHPAS